jgi:hypothetical protein
MNRLFGGTYRLHLQQTATCSRWFLARGFSALKMEAIHSSETSVHTKSTRCQIPEDGIFSVTAVKISNPTREVQTIAKALLNITTHIAYVSCCLVASVYSQLPTVNQAIRYGGKEQGSNSE